MNRPFDFSAQAREERATDPALLASALALMYDRAIRTGWELDMPCRQEHGGAFLARIAELLQALKQQPTPEEISSWEQSLTTYLAEGAQRDPAPRLAVALELADEMSGLAGGFVLQFSFIPEENPAALLDSGAAPDQLLQVRGVLRLPCLPSFLGEQVRLLGNILRALGQRHLGAEDLEGWRASFAPLLPEWFAQSANACLQVQFASLDPAIGLAGGIDLEVSRIFASIESHYQRWSRTREGPLFGEHPDAMALNVAACLGEAAAAPVLDVGAGTGRNSLALARLGHPVDALELTVVLTEQLDAAVEAEGLPVRVLQGDIFDAELALPPSSYRLVLLSEVIASHFRSVDELRRLLIRACELLAPGGMLLFDVFLADPDFEPSAAAREMSQLYWCWLLTPTELQQALAGLPLVLVADEAVLDYERTHLPPELWPPTRWYVQWTSGRNLFPVVGRPPVERHWLLCRR
ncbi:class I SAM-dependent methyltransferase [Gloeobacter kilaueensis]|uniref:Tellurite resistance protein TehB n=1 Tax=Gloeobacter kilaueensis (strain ATCC BAA-2537 / CCAP 1431/1 / ULC 316 / JS1) TaxID=1183438 RepID=U5QMG2_GLOK1|nr:class I SAM-dependent methyltransferase [Gloeobacter kilaueensis]AGY60083.1 tellurite resistance protein TehB [Gloeobacter kilaueensis JS1]